MPFFAPERDRHFIGVNYAELHRKAFFRVPVYFPNDIPSDYTALYAETFKEHWEEYPYHNITAYYRLDPPQQQWTKFGIAEERDVVAYFSRHVLDKGYYDKLTNSLVPFPYPVEGCAMWVDNVLYRITDIKDIDFYGNVVESWLTRIAFGVEIRPSSVKDQVTEVEALQNVPPLTSFYGE